MAQRMMLTTGGPALRRMGREVEGYVERGADWEDVDSGLLLLVCIVIKLAGVQPEAREETNGLNVWLHAELVDDGAALSPVHIVEGAKDDDRCGIGIHAEHPGVLSDEIMARWGKNQLGHACMVCCRYIAAISAESPAVAASEPSTVRRVGSVSVTVQ
mmetsp:Transcript_35022/g.74726  ORF Transcript_35022/g.74726 Transcript_35022/m.74726 type:complete len:158 (+) Transcript_35022:1420-1893(+)